MRKLTLPLAFVAVSCASAPAIKDPELVREIAGLRADVQRVQSTLDRAIDNSGSGCPECPTTDKIPTHPKLPVKSCVLDTRALLRVIDAVETDCSESNTAAAQRALEAANASCNPVSDAVSDNPERDDGFLPVRMAHEAAAGLVERVLDKCEAEKGSESGR